MMALHSVLLYIDRDDLKLLAHYVTPKINKAD